MSEKINRLAKRFSYVLSKSARLNKKADGHIQELSNHIQSGLMRDMITLANQMYGLNIEPSKTLYSVNAEFESNRYQVAVTIDFQNTEMRGGQTAIQTMPFLNNKKDVQNLINVILSLSRKYFTTWPKMKKEDGTLYTDTVYVSVLIKADGKVLYNNPYTTLPLSGR